MKFVYAFFLSFAVFTLPIVSHAGSDTLEGTWSGGGYIKPKDGAREKVRCRVRYRKETNTVYHVSASCAAASTKLSQSGSVLKVSGNKYVGEFHNAEFNVSGRVRIIVSGRRQSVTLTASNGVGKLSLSKR